MATKIRTVQVHQDGRVWVADGTTVNTNLGNRLSSYDLDAAIQNGAKIVGESIQVGTESVLLTVEEPSLP